MVGVGGDRHLHRRAELLRTLDELTRLPEAPAVVVVDNGSTDGTAEGVRERHPGVNVVVASPAQGPSARSLTDEEGAAFLDALDA